MVNVTNHSRATVIVRDKAGKNHSIAAGGTEDIALDPEFHGNIAKTRAGLISTGSGKKATEPRPREQAGKTTAEAGAVSS